jgi:hypothetical protein
MSLHCSNQRDYCPYPRWYMSMEDLGGISAEENSWFVHQSCLAIPPAESCSSKSGGTGRRNDEFGLTKYLFHTSKGFVTFRKILRHGANGFSSPSKKGVLRTLKIYRPRPGSNPRTVGPMVSTLAITPPRMTWLYLFGLLCVSMLQLQSVSPQFTNQGPNEIRKLD